MTCFEITPSLVLAHTQAAPKELVGPCTDTTRCTHLAAYCSISEKGAGWTPLDCACQGIPVQHWPRKGPKHMWIHRQLTTPLEFGRAANHKSHEVAEVTGDVRVASLIHHKWVPSKAELGTTWAQDIPGNIPGPPSTKPRSMHVLPNQHRVTLARCSAERRCPDSCDVSACRPKTGPSLTHFAARDRPDFTFPL